MELTDKGQNASADLAVLVERDQGAAFAGLDKRHARRTVRRDPQPLALLVPGDGEGVQALGQGGDRLAGLPALQDLPVDQARHPNGAAIACDPFDQPMVGVDRDDGLRRAALNRLRRDQRSEPAKSLCNLE